MKIDIVVTLNEETGYIGLEAQGSIYQITPARAAEILHCKIGDLKEMIHPHRTYHADGSYSFGFGYGEATGIFYRDLLKHEWRMGHTHEGIELSLTTWGGFPIYPMQKNGKTMYFNTEAEALAYLNERLSKWNAIDLDESEE